MNPIQGSRRSVCVLVSIICLLGAPLAAQTLEPPFFGPPGSHANTVPGRTDTDGVSGPSDGDAFAYFSWMAAGQAIMADNPWTECAQHPEAFVLAPSMSGMRQGIYDTFDNWAFARGFTFDTYDNFGDPIGGTYWSEIGDSGTANLEKSSAGNNYYDLIRLAGSTPGRQIDVVLPLVEHHVDGDGFPDFIGVANIASLGVIGACGNADETTDVSIPLGRSNGQPAIILDLEGDGVPSAGFLASPPLGGLQPPGPAIPTLSAWGAALLAMSLLAVGLLIIRLSGGSLSV